MELLQLRYFMTVAQMLNISRAAKHHMIPQPAMSQTISKLEKELDTKLFDRYKNRLSLTEEGDAFYRSVSTSIRELDNAVQELNRTDAPLSGELKILVLQHRDTVVDCMMAFKKQYPQVSFRISYEQDSQDCQDFDLCISCQQPDENFNESVCLITEQLKLLVCANHPLAAAEAVPFRDLQDEEFAIISRSSNPWIQTELHCRQAGFEPRISITCADLHCLLKYVGAGMAITVGPEIAWKGLDLQSSVFIPTQPEIFRSTYVFRNKRKSTSRLSSIYRDFLVEYFRTLSAPEVP